MKRIYVLEEDDIRKAKERLRELKHVALLSRDAGQAEDNREYYLRAKGFEDALIILGIFKESRVGL